MSEQNQDKKPKKSFFMFGKKPEKYDWDIKKERERDRRIVDSFNFAIEGLTAALRNEKHIKFHNLPSIIENIKSAVCSTESFVESTSNASSLFLKGEISLVESYSSLFFISLSVCS